MVKEKRQKVYETIPCLIGSKKKRPKRPLGIRGDPA
nr:MAG TPA: hypothetical protein [Caudoviricetes sp.]